jgi:hypothetical protein
MPTRTYFFAILPGPNCRSCRLTVDIDKSPPSPQAIFGCNIGVPGANTSSIRTKTDQRRGR